MYFTVFLNKDDDDDDDDELDTFRHDFRQSALNIPVQF